MARKKGKELDSKGALLEAAWALLLERGADGMSVEAIVSRANLSKGTFFHFFPTKQELLDALCARIADESWRQINVVFQRTDLDPVARLDLFLHTSRGWRLERSKAFGGLWLELMRDQNAAVMRKVTALGTARLAPVLAALIEEGNASGLMHVADAEAVAQLALEWLYSTAEGNVRLFFDKRDASAFELAVRRANAAIEALERVLVTAPGAFRRVDRETLARFAADVPKDEDTKDQIQSSHTAIKLGRAETNRVRVVEVDARNKRPPRRKQGR